MGKTIRRVTEAVLQGLQLLHVPVDQSFQPTSNARNEFMLKDVTDFSQHIRTIEKDLRAMQKQITGQFQNLRNIMITPLPKVYNWAFDKAYEDEVVAQPQQPVDGQSSNGSIGNCVNIERMEKALEDMNTRLDTEVYKPLQEWMSGYKDVQSAMRVLEAKRLELDSRKRTVATLDRKLTLQKDRKERDGPGANNSMPLARIGSIGRPAGYDPVAEIEKTAQRKAEKSEDSQTKFDRAEESVFQSLQDLIVRAAHLRAISVRALLHTQNFYTTAISAFDAPDQESMPMALPAPYAEEAPKAQSQQPIAPAGNTRKGSVYNAAAQDLAVSQYDQAGFDAVPQGKVAPPAPVADVAPRYIQHAGAGVPIYANSPSRRFHW